ncbi:hypothetical protein M3Y98_00734500 [Aphelenchoides besseyi]|nr:hypothetical protein M3Y98_00734500 [Aphelenchoides besseyi]KAI6211402.1 hypothetical protein M3Y96_00430400 [Aphelenchoides besseyi]
MIVTYLLAILALILLVAIDVNAIRANFNIQGTLLCRKEPAIGFHLAIYETDNPNADPDDLCYVTKTDKQGKFIAHSWKNETKPYSYSMPGNLYYVVLHNCTVDEKPACFKYDAGKKVWHRTDQRNRPFTQLKKIELSAAKIVECSYRIKFDIRSGYQGKNCRYD